MMPGDGRERQTCELAVQMGEAVRRARRARGISQYMLADESGVAQGDISLLENGKRNCTLRMADRLAYCLGCRLILQFVEPEEAGQERV